MSGTHKADRTPVVLTPSRPDLEDAGFTLCLGLLALAEFHSTYAGSAYLVVGALGLVLGVLITHLANALRQPALILAAMGVAAFFLLGGAVALRNAPGGNVLPTGGTLRSLANTSIHGWRDLLTTVPPVDGSGPLLVLPYMLGLLGGLGGYALARRLRGAFWPVTAMAGVFAAVILLGSLGPQQIVPIAVMFGLVALGWVSLREQRERPVNSSGSGQATRAAVSAALLGFSSLGAYLVGPHIAGVSAQDRVVLRKYVSPPFTIGDYPSPLSEYRLYATSQKLSNQTVGLAKQTLFRVTGSLPAGTPIQFATLDSYNGSVWAASNSSGGEGGKPNSFLRVGPTLDNPASGKRYSMSVAIESYDDYWMPVAGAVQSLRFTDSTAVHQSEDFRYNLATGTGVVPGKLSHGASYQLTVTGIKESELQPSDSLAGDGYTEDGSFLKDTAAKLAGGDGNTTAQVIRMGQALKSIGRYTHGDASSGFEYYLPGHSVGRLTSFVKGIIPGSLYIGDDEQYASAYALMIQQLGVPARVVLGVESLPEDGLVTGANVSAWVQVKAANGTWLSIPSTSFLDRNRQPEKKQLQQKEKEAPGAQVPPPAQGRPKTAVDDSAQSKSNSRDLTKKASAADGFRIPAWVMTVLDTAGPPIMLILLVVGTIIGLKAWRRNHRRTRGSPAMRLARGWREILDHAHDLGTPVAARTTRREQARILEAHDVSSLAVLADSHVFGAADITDEDARAYWADIETARRRMSASVGRWRRWRAAVNVVTFFGHSPTRRR